MTSNRLPIIYRIFNVEQRLICDYGFLSSPISTVAFLMFIHGYAPTALPAAAVLLCVLSITALLFPYRLSALAGFILVGGYLTLVTDVGIGMSIALAVLHGFTVASNAGFIHTCRKQAI